MVTADDFSPLAHLSVRASGDRACAPEVAPDVRMKLHRPWYVPLRCHRLGRFLFSHPLASNPSTGVCLPRPTLKKGGAFRHFVVFTKNDLMVSPLSHHLVRHFSQITQEATSDSSRITHLSPHRPFTPLHLSRHYDVASDGSKGTPPATTFPRE